MVERTGELSGASYLQDTQQIRFKEMNFGEMHSVYSRVLLGVLNPLYPRKCPSVNEFVYI